MGILLYLVTSFVLFTFVAMLVGISSALWGFGILHWVCSIWVLFCAGSAIEKQNVEDSSTPETSPVPNLSSST